MALSEIGKLVEKMQAERGLSDEKLADAAGFTKQNLYQIKRSKRPYLTTIHNLAKALNVEVDIFLACRG